LPRLKLPTRHFEDPSDIEGIEGFYPSITPFWDACVFDTKREENGVTEYLRPAAITYVALEFTWPRKDSEAARIETWGLRIEFRNSAENQGHIKPFVCFGPLTKAD